MQADRLMRCDEIGIARANSTEDAVAQEEPLGLERMGFVTVIRTLATAGCQKGQRYAQ